MSDKEQRPATSEDSEGGGQDELEPAGRKLDSLADVRRAVKFVLRRIESGTLDKGTGHILLGGLATLSTLLMDKRDSMWTKRAALLWAEREQHLRRLKEQPVKQIEEGEVLDAVPADHE